MYARVPKVMAQFVLKIEKIVPYHGVNPNTRNGAHLRSPSPIMAPDAVRGTFMQDTTAIVPFTLRLAKSIQ